MAPLDDVREAAQAIADARQAEADARLKLALAIAEARADGVPLTACARAAGVSRKTAERLLRLAG